MYGHQCSRSFTEADMHIFQGYFMTCMSRSIQTAHVPFRWEDITVSYQHSYTMHLLYRRAMCRAQTSAALYQALQQHAPPPPLLFLHHSLSSPVRATRQSYSKPNDHSICTRTSRIATSALLPSAMLHGSCWRGLEVRFPHATCTQCFRRRE